MYLKVIAELREFHNFKARLPEASRCISQSRSHLPLSLPGNCDHFDFAI